MTRKRGPKPKTSSTYDGLRQAEVLALPHISTSWGDVERIAVHTHDIAPATKADKLRMAENAKLDKMERPLMRIIENAAADAKATSGQLSQAVYAVLKIMERRAKLNGLDMHTGAHVSFSQVEIVYKDKDTGRVIDAPAWSVDPDADSD